MAENQEGQFSLLNAGEVASRFNEFCKSGEKVVVWSKGSNEKFEFRAHAFNKDQSLLEVSLIDAKEPKVLFGLNVLGQTSQKTLQYFFSGQFSFDKMNHVYLIKLTDKIFKFEKRKNFRLSTFPRHQVKLHLNLPEDFQPPTNVLNLAKRGEQTKLFKSFLEMLHQTKSGGKTSYEINFRIQDISINGLSFIIGDLEKKFIFENIHFEKALLEFNEEEFSIPKIRVVYVMDYIDPSKPGTKLYKVGMQLMNLDLETDNRLSMKISKELRESDMNKVFEDFLK